MSISANGWLMILPKIRAQSQIEYRMLLVAGTSYTARKELLLAGRIGLHFGRKTDTFLRIPSFRESPEQEIDFSRFAK